MSRSIKKGPYINERLLKKVEKIGMNKKTIIKTWARSATITPEMVGYIFGVHNGKQHISVLAVENMVGHKLGEFSLTRKFTRHGGRMQKEQEQAAAQKQGEAGKASKTSAAKK